MFWQHCSIHPSSDSSEDAVYNTAFKGSYRKLEIKIKDSSVTFLH